MKFEKLLSFFSNLFNLDHLYKDAYDISVDDIEEFFDHLRSSGKTDYTMSYFYKWYKEYREKLKLKG